MAPQKIGVIGLGLIGGSAAKALKAHTPHLVYGADRDRQVLGAALHEGTIDGALTPERLHECDVVLPALYPGATVCWVREMAPHIAQKALMVDLCGVKRAVHEQLRPLARDRGFYYIGGHPMAGTERSGYGASAADLFGGASMILTPDADTPSPVLQKAERLFLSMGFGGVTLSTPEHHDRIIAYTSQLAHVLSSAYVKSPSATAYRGFSAGSFRDMTRVARLNETMWTELFLDNSDFLAEEVEGLSQRLTEYAAALRQRDGERLCALLREGRERKEWLEEGT